MWRAAMAMGFLMLQGVPQAATDAAITRLKMPSGLAQIVVRRAIEGAARRLQDRQCQQVLTDFKDLEGRTLLANLQARKRKAAEFLLELWFVDASDRHQCLLSDAAAFTAPGSRVIFVCGSRFADRSFALEGRRGEITIIHEMLHSLGLGENPPKSDRITEQVMARCDPRSAG